MTFKPNQIIDKRYKIIELLGQGGMGAVWRALDQQMGDESKSCQEPISQ